MIRKRDLVFVGLVCLLVGGFIGFNMGVNTVVSHAFEFAKQYNIVNESALMELMHRAGF